MKKLQIIDLELFRFFRENQNYEGYMEAWQNRTDLPYMMGITEISRSRKRIIITGHDDGLNPVVVEIRKSEPRPRKTGPVIDQIYAVPASPSPKLPSFEDIKRDLIENGITVDDDDILCVMFAVVKLGNFP